MEGEPAARIRDAIDSGEYQKALRLWNGYAAQVRAEIRKGTLSMDALAEARELVAWSRTVLNCARAHALDRLNTLHAAGAYGSGARRKAGLIRASL